MAEKNASSDQRKTESLIRDLIDLVPPSREPPKLTREEPRGGIPQRRGYAETNQQPGTGGQSGGLASPLTEGDTAGTVPTDPVLARTYHPLRQITSTDGLFVWEVTPPASITFVDNEGAIAQLKYADPYAEPDPAP